MKDITERKKAEQQKEFDRRNLKALINNTTDLIWSVDRDIKLITSNKAFDEWFTLKSGKPVKRCTNVLEAEWNEEVLIRWRKNYERAFSGEKLTEVEFFDSATETWSKVSFHPIRKGDAVIGAACYSRNITEKKKNEKIIRDERTLLRTLVDNLPFNVYAKDIHSKKTLANRGDCEFMGASSEKEALGKDDADFFSDEFARKTFMEEQQMFATGQPIIDEEEQYETNDGRKKWFLKSKIPLRNEDGQIIGLVGISYDITDRKKNEIAIAELNAQLNKRAEELTVSNAELERFAYVVSHDLLEPLRMVSNFLQLLRRKYAGQLDETADQYIHYAVDGAERMKTLILDLLEYSRVGTNSDQFIMTDMNEVTKSVLQTFNTSIQEKGALVTIQKMPVIKANKTQMIQLFQNLLGNALKYNNSLVPEIEIGYKEKKDAWQFFVKDNGIGIEQKYFDKVFAIFQRLHNKNQYSGTGIGLAICKKIAEKHAGNIWIESSHGNGSTFFFTIKKQ